MSGLAAGLIACMPVAAQEPGGADAAQPGGMDSLVEELRWLEAERLAIQIPTVFGASRFEQKSVKAPASVTVVTREQIEKYGYETIADVLRSLRGFTVMTDRVYDLVGVRGFDDPGDLNRKILVVVDGHRMNDCAYDMGQVDRTLPVDIDLIERIEVVRGPISALYGSNAYLALINVVTRKASDIGGGEAAFGYGTFDTSKGRFTYGGSLGKGLDLVLSATSFGNTGSNELYYAFYDGNPADGRPDHDGERVGQGFLKLSYGELTLQAGWAERHKEDPTGAFWVDWNDDVENIDEHWYVDMRFRHTFAEDWDFEARLFYHNYSFWWEGEYGGIPNVAEALGKCWGTEFLLTKPVSDRHTLTAGFEFRDNFRQTMKSFDLPPAPADLADTEASSDIWALFVQDQFEMTDNLILNAGLRSDHYSTFGSTLNPRAALIYNPFAKTILKILYGEAFRAPSAHEVFFEDGENSLLDNPDLDPETVRTYEAVLEQYLGRNYRLTLSMFRNELRDVISQVDIPWPIPGDPTKTLAQYQNLGTFRATGCELELEAAWDNGVEGRISYGYRDAEDRETGERVLGSAKQLGKLGLSVPVIQDTVFCSVEVLYVDGRPTVDGKATDEAGDYCLANVTVLGKEVVDGLDLSVSVRNVFDKHYEDIATVNMEQDVLHQDGRTVWAELTYRF